MKGTETNQARKNSKLNILLTVGYVCSVFLLHILPSFIFDAVQPRQQLFMRTDSLVHIIMFFPWMFMDGSVLAGKVLPGRKLWFYWLAYGSSACIFFECCQLLASSRSFSFEDMSCNLLGLALGAPIAAYFNRRKLMRHPQG